VKSLHVGSIHLFTLLALFPFKKQDVIKCFTSFTELSKEIFVSYMIFYRQTIWGELVNLTGQKECLTTPGG
jgi:hypothetical protein